MKLQEYGRALWRRYLIKGMAFPLLLISVLFVVIGFLDYYLRLSIAWRLLFIISFAVYISYMYRRLKKLNQPPKLDELEHLACRMKGDKALITPADELTLPASSLKKINLKPYLLLTMIVMGCLFVDSGRTAFTRLILLTGEWPKRTRITNVVVPEFVEEGKPIRVQFSTEGLIPSLVTFVINDEEKKITRHANSSVWHYDFFHSPGSVRILIKAGDDVFGPVNVSVIPVPRLVHSQILIRDPPYLGGRPSSVDGLTAQVNQGSDIVLQAKFNRIHSIHSPESMNLNAEGYWCFGADSVSQDLVLHVTGKGHEGLPVSELCTFRVHVVADREPSITRRLPQGMVTCLDTARLDLKYDIEDDHALERIELNVDGTPAFHEVVQGNHATFEHTLLLADMDLSDRNEIQVVCRARDNHGVWGESVPLTVRIVDLTTYKQMISEQHQQIHVELENLIQSMDRRLKRHVQQKMLERDVEKNATRSDLNRVDQLTKRFEDYIRRLKEVEDLAPLTVQSDQHKNFIDINVRSLLEDMITRDDVDADRQKTILDELKEMSRIMAQAQEFHLVIQYLDEIILRQKRTVDNIPE